MHALFHDSQIDYMSPNGKLRLIEVVTVGHVVKGKVEVLLNKQWKPICASFAWDHNDSTVVCRELGYKGKLTVVCNLLCVVVYIFVSKDIILFTL